MRSKCTKACRLDEAAVLRTYSRDLSFAPPWRPQRESKPGTTPRLSWTPAPTPSFPKRGFIYFGPQLVFSHYFLVLGLLGRGWSLWGPLGRGPCAVLGEGVGTSVGGGGWLFLKHSELHCPAWASVSPTESLGGPRIGGLRVLGKSMRPKIFWGCGLTFSQHPLPPPLATIPLNKKYFYFIKTA